MRAHKMGRGWYISPEEVERYRRESLGSRRLRPRPSVEVVA